LRRPDGRVDPGKRTITAMNDPNSASVWQRMCIPPEASATARPARGVALDTPPKTETKEIKNVYSGTH
ncbi:MAG: hypothetical protein AAF709_23560, partial [Pseudomonadota bacterium]